MPQPNSSTTQPSLFGIGECTASVISMPVVRMTTFQEVISHPNATMWVILNFSSINSTVQFFFFFLSQNANYGLREIFKLVRFGLEGLRNIDHLGFFNVH